MIEPNLPQGAVRQESSGALIFPVHPKELEREKTLRELEVELGEIRSLKEELLNLKKDLTTEN